MSETKERVGGPSSREITVSTADEAGPTAADPAKEWADARVHDVR